MNSERRLQSLPDDELLEQLSTLLDRSRRDEAALVTHIGEVDRRRLYAREASPSMFVYCTDVLHLSEHEAYLRITAARAARQHPALLVMLADGRLHLSGIAKLAPQLTKENRDSVLARATHRTKRQIEELVAELAPKPDVPPSIRKVPDRAPKVPPPPQLGPGRVTNLHVSRNEPVAGPPISLAPAPAPKAPRVEPLSPARYKIQFTASAELKEKLERLQALMRDSVPDGDLAAVLEEAVTEKLQRLEAKRFAEAKAPRTAVEHVETSPKSRHIPNAVKRAVRKRDGDRCSYRNDAGKRCTERHRLEFHHHDPYGYGGGHDVENVSLRCRAHNLYQSGARLPERGDGSVPEAARSGARARARLLDASAIPNASPDVLRRARGRQLDRPGPAPHVEVAVGIRLHALPFRANGLGAPLATHHAHGLALDDLRLGVDAGVGAVAESPSSIRASPGARDRG